PAAERLERCFVGQEAELLVQLARGRRAWRLVRLDETGGELPEDAGELRRDRAERDRRPYGASEIHAWSTAGVEMVRRDDGGIERPSLDEIVRKRGHVRSAARDGELVAFQREKPVRLPRTVSDDLELDVGDLRQGRHGGRILACSPAGSAHPWRGSTASRAAFRGPPLRIAPPDWAGIPATMEEHTAVLGVSEETFSHGPTSKQKSLVRS